MTDARDAVAGSRADRDRAPRGDGVGGDARAAADSATDDRVAVAYDALDARGRALLAARAVVVEPPPLVGDPRWGVTAVLRPQPWTAALGACADACATVLGPRHAVYDATGLHVTVRAIEGFRGPVAVDDPAVAAYAAAMRPVLARTASIAVRLAGVAAAPTGLVVRGYAGAALQALRDALHGCLAALPTEPPGPEMNRADLRTTAHATLAVYGEAVANADAVGSFVDAHRATPFGTWSCDALWLVRYRRDSHAVTVTTLARLPFGDARC